MIKCPMAVAAALCASLLMAEEELVLTGDHPITVASGQTSTMSAKVTGTGRIVLDGGGTLVFSNAGNDFTGGIVVSNGVVRADASGAFGTGPITLEGTSSSRQIQLNAQGGVFPNSITLTDVAAPHKAIHATKSARLDGDIGLGPGCSTGFYVGCRADSGSVTVTIDGDIDIPKLKFTGIGNFVCNGKVSASSAVMAGDGSEDYGLLTLNNPENDIAQLTVKAFQVHCGAENVLYGSSVFLDYNWYGNSGYRGSIFLHGFDQTFTTINYRTSNRYWLFTRDNSCVTILTPENDPATVTLIGPGSAFGYCRLAGPVSVVIDKKTETMYQRFLYRDNSMTGDFTLKNGSCYWMNGVEFSNLTNLVLTGGSLQFESVTNCCPKLRKMEVSGGTVGFKSSCKDVFNAELTDLHLSGAAKFYIASGLTNTVRSLYVDGKRKSAGVYTFENLPAMKHETGSGDYSGVLIVNRGGNLRLIVR